MIDLAIDDRISINSILDAALQELDMLFNTKCTEVIGNPRYGTNFESFLWDITMSDEHIKKYIRDVINEHTFFLHKFDYTIEIEEGPGTVRDVFYIKIEIDAGKDSPAENDEKNEEEIPKYRRVYMLR